MRVVNDVLKDEMFQFNSKPARGDRKAAVRMLLNWATKEENLSAAEGFLKSLQNRFDECLKVLNLNRERLWRSFYILRGLYKVLE